MDLVTLRIYDTPVEAHLLKTKLESIGVKVVLQDENMSSIYPFYSVMKSGGVKLLIHPMDLERSLEIIQAIEETPYTREDDSVLKCPNCGSVEFYSGWASQNGFQSILGSILAVMGFAGFRSSKTVYRCKRCDTEFTNQ